MFYFLGSLACADVAVEKKLQAALLVQFGKVAEFKDATLVATETFVIAVGGDADLKATLNDFASGKKIKGKRIEIDELSGDKPTRPAHIVFVGGSAEKSISALGGCHCMVVGFGNGLASKGAVINFIRQDAGIKFEISPKAASKENIELGADLIRLGKAVD